MNNNIAVVQPTVQAPQSRSRSIPAPAEMADSPSFRQVMQQAATKSATQEASTQAEGGMRILAVDGVENKISVAGKMSFLAAMFGADALKGVDLEQGDMDILKDVYKNLNDPEAQFAIILMMAFLEANPEKTMADFEQQMGSELLSDPSVTPLQKVFSAVTRMMSSDPTLKSSSMMDQMMQMAQSGKVTNKPLSEEFLREIDLQLVSSKVSQQSGMTQNAEARPLVSVSAETLSRFEQMLKQVRQPDNLAAQTGGTGETRESGVRLDVEKLQQQVDTGSYLRSSNYQNFRVEQAGGVNLGMAADAADLINQVKTGVFTGLDAGETEIILKLRPEGLGEMTVRLVETGSKTILSIVASNAQTQRMLNAELGNLQAAMKPYEVEVQQVVSTQQTATGDQFSEGQLAQQFGEHQHQSGAFQQNSTEQIMGEEQQDVALDSMARMADGVFDTYI